MMMSWNQLYRKKKNGIKNKYMFYTDFKQMFSTAIVNSILVRIANYKKNYEYEKSDIKKNIVWYLEIRKTLLDISIIIAPSFQNG